MLRLLSLLQTGRPWPAEELASAMGSTPRTLRRDIEHLRAMGYPVESARGPGGNYRLVAGSALPPLMLEDEEAVATVLGLKLASAGGTGLETTTEAAERAAAKLRRLLPAPLRHRTDEVLAAVEVAGWKEYPLPRQAVLSAFAAAISAHRRAVFEYAGKLRTSQRTVEPARLVRLRQRWYLVAWDVDRHDWRTFRLDRIAEPVDTGGTFRPRELPAADLAGFLSDRFRGTDTYRVELTLHTDAQDAATRLHRVDGSLEPLGADRCRYATEVDSYEWLATVLLLSGIEFSVERPAAFSDYLTRAAHRLLRGAENPSAADD